MRATSLAPALLSAALTACGQPTQTQDELNTGTSLNPSGQSASRESVAALVDLSASAERPCSATFISTTQAVTAAHCVRSGVAPSSYQLVLQSPLGPASLSVPVSAIFVHPLWNGDEQLAVQHVQSVYEGSATPPLATQSLYDLAVLTVSLSPPGLAPQIPGALPGGPLSVSAVAFKRTLNGTERTAELLTALNAAPTAFTVVGAASVSDTPGGAAASVSVSGAQALMGVHAGGIAGVGAVFVRLDAHRRFLDDAVTGVTTGDYRVSSGTSEPLNPNPNPNPTNPPPPAFDCSRTSDRFCDVVCAGDVDCEVATVQYKPFGIPCADSSECSSGVCLRFDTQTTRCSEYCGGNTMCPLGFECREAESGRLVCGTPLSNGGTPPPPPPSQKYFGADCRTNADCSTGFCVTSGGRKWCSSRCTNDDACPISYVCAAVPEGKACVPPGTQMTSMPPSP